MNGCDCFALSGTSAHDPACVGGHLPKDEQIRSLEAMLAAKNEMLIELREDLADYRTAYQTLKNVLKEYADAKNWAISRDDLNHPVVSWIGPGAAERPPRPIGLAESAINGW